MQTPEKLIEFVKQIVSKNPDANVAVQKSLEKARGLAEWEEWKEQLAMDAVQQLVYDIRHRATIQIKTESGMYSGESRQPESTRLQDSCKVFNSFYVQSKRLVDFRKEELKETAEVEEQLADGHLRVASLLRKLIPLTKSGRTVAQSVPTRRLIELCEEVGLDFNGEAKEVAEPATST